MKSTAPRGGPAVRFNLLRVGWLIFAAGVLWDLTYHTVQLLLPAVASPAFDALGDLGHIITFAGVTLIILTLLRERPSRH